MKYREKYGSLTLHRVLEQGAALVAYVQACSVPRKSGARAPRYEEFLPQRPQEISLEQAMKTWK